MVASVANKIYWRILITYGWSCFGKEGPSIQLGAMAGKGISRALDRGKTEEKFLLTCGASAGLSAPFMHH